VFAPFRRVSPFLQCRLASSLANAADNFAVLFLRIFKSDNTKQLPQETALAHRL
jgi:hypothetical protein